jgi:pimeloyl-ACP methyl ester carboxylesterase
MDSSPHTTGFVSANGIRLHYLDWGGTGPVLLFIPGWGCTAHIFDSFAPRFKDHFHVLAVTRRGHGESDYPETGYDPDTLAEDIRQFLDVLHIDQAILAGHSLGYIEVSRFAAFYPNRALKLVYIDAAYDRTSPEFQALMSRNPVPKMLPPWPATPIASIEEFSATIRKSYPSLAAIWGPDLEADLHANVYLNSEGNVVEKSTDAINAAIQATIDTYQADYASLTVPMLSIFVLIDGTDFLSPDFMSEQQQAQVLDYFQNDRIPYKQNYIDQFRTSVPNARVVVIPRGHHYCFIQQPDQVYDAMCFFLLEP